MTILATAGQTWGGETVGIVAAVLFVLFASWIGWQRWRQGHSSADATQGDDVKQQQEKVDR